MTTKDLAKLAEFTLLAEGFESEIKGLYCCDLLSHVMGQSLEGNAWCTVMANLNSLAVASLSDASCMILCHDLQPTPEMIKTATAKEINLFITNLSEFDAALLIGKTGNLI